MFAGMKTCVICGETYQKDLPACPFCGCPADRYSFVSFGYPEELASSYELIGLKDTGGAVPAVLMEDPNTKQHIFAARIPDTGGEEFFLNKLQMQKQNNFRELPEVYGIFPEEGYYIYEEIKGQTIQDLLEHENPLDPQSAGHVMNELNHTFQALRQSGFRYGPISPFSCCITPEGIRLTDFGSNREYDDDENAMERMGFRLLQGRWPGPEDQSLLPAYAPDEMAKGIEKRMAQDSKKTRTRAAAPAAAFAGKQGKPKGHGKALILSAVICAALIITVLVIVTRMLGGEKPSEAPVKPGETEISEMIPASPGEEQQLGGAPSDEENVIEILPDPDQTK